MGNLSEVTRHLSAFMVYQIGSAITPSGNWCWTPKIQQFFHGKTQQFFGASWASQISGPQATRPLFPEIIRSYSNLYIAGNLEEVGLLWNIGMGQNLLYQGCEHHLPALGFTGMLLTAIYASCLWIGEQNFAPVSWVKTMKLPTRMGV